MRLSAYRSTLPERLEHSFLRFLIKLAVHLPRVLLGPPRRTADGTVLHPEMALFLLVQRLRGAVGLAAGGVASARYRMSRDLRVHSGQPVAVGAVREMTYPGAKGPLRARHYLPPGRGRKPLLLFIHGGGFALGDLDTHDQPCRVLCAEADMHVLSVEYRLAPEHPFPAAIEDAYAAFRFAQENAAELGADSDCIAIGGDSAGATISAVVSQLAKQRGDRLPALHLLIYPAADWSKESESVITMGEGLFLTRADIQWFQNAYLGEQDPKDVRVSPLLSPDLTGLPPAIVVSAGFDPLCDESEAYARALQSAGNRVVHYRAPQLIHGFVNLIGFSPHAAQSLRAIARLTRRELMQSGRLEDISNANPGCRK